MSRWAAGVEYVGTAFRGWQSLSELRCVQSTLEAALSKVADHPVAVTAAGRTDSGVHGLQQVVHFDSGARRSEYAWLLGSNTNLPPDLSLRWVQPVAQQFHARFSARARHYRYVIHNHRARGALLRERAAWWPQRLDAEAMHQAAQVLLGEQDFSAFRDSECQAPTATRYMRHVNVFRRGDFVVIDLCANAFLHHMVRNITGTLAEVGLGKRPVPWVAEVLASRERSRAGMTAPACGLYFVGPEYPAEFALPERPEPYFPA
ncbi:tRNA pseudouridine(38-40) synthase TruA [Solimonas sp. K1W22B-7]|uniref:tRNA pseudouridine(38-40) synthase TruA n=1 Tax=Solimonas sp. K1W22B-7 TaxID=2303331 RepID=UPI000E334B33|nr:tRNA pseudouridine(38-40) synthase TruA [Solimonas sp. K1W22B-7]AXQ29466.1 tRNA pseudouridine(38-40) synthase TruA [Solimonas sp. K1W22B-7]